MKANSNEIVSEQEKTEMIEKLEKNFYDVLTTLKFDVDTDQQIVDTPKRMARMYVNELFSGCYTEAPKLTIFDNVDSNNDLVFLGPISIKSTCSHHIIPFIGNAYISYIPNKKVVGISKIARTVKWFMRRPQIQEELTKQIADYLYKELEPLGVAVRIEAQHLCMIARGVEEYNSNMKTTALRGDFLTNSSLKKEFLNMI